MAYPSRDIKIPLASGILSVEALNWRYCDRSSCPLESCQISPEARILRRRPYRVSAILLCNDYSSTCGFSKLNRIVFNKSLKRRMSEKLVTEQEHHKGRSTQEPSRLLLPKAGSIFFTDHPVSRLSIRLGTLQ